MHDASALEIVILVGTGLAAGFINTLAGAGSLLTIPALMLLGMPADVANATNRVSVLATCVSGAVGFTRAGKLERGRILPIAAPAVVGAIVGAWAASRVPEPVLRGILLVTMIAMGALLVASPRVLAPDEGTEPVDVRRRPLSLLWLFLAGLYGGFVQAGVGLLLLAILGGVLRYDLIRANALKIVITGVFTAAALIVFIVLGKILWAPGAILAASTVVGAQLGVRFALRLGQGAVRWIVLLMVAAMVLAVIVKS
jgi:uncharacterized protein